MLLCGSCSFAGKHCFNPRPTVWPGDAVFDGSDERHVRVSIRARLFGRAMPFIMRPSYLTPSCFNPRPTVWPGDAPLRRLRGDHAAVSIRARLFGRAMLYTRNSLLPMKILVSSREPASKSNKFLGIGFILYE